MLQKGLLKRAAGFPFLFCAVLASAAGTKPVVVGYVFPQNSILQDGQIDVRGMTRINYAFANIKDGRMVEGFPTDGRNLAWLNAQKHKDPSLVILISVGGWLWSGGFSDAARTPQSRKTFADSVMDFLHRYGLDGLDMDWEYPGMPGAGHTHRRQDRHNFTLLLEELHNRFRKEFVSTHKRLYLTIAAGASEDYLEHTEMAKAQRYVDAVNLMAYDYYQAGSDSITGHHAPLFANPRDPKRESADASVKAFERAGVPTAKIVLGVPFYGRMWGDVADLNHGLFQPGKPIANGYAPYSRIAGTMLDDGFTRYWDASASAPYLYSEQQHIFVSYEDPESLTEKCKYVLAHHLAGVMFWSYSDDSTGALLSAIDRALDISSGGQDEGR